MRATVIELIVRSLNINSVIRTRPRLLQCGARAAALQLGTSEWFKEGWVCDKHHSPLIRHACQTRAFITKFADGCNPLYSAIHFLRLPPPHSLLLCGVWEQSRSEWVPLVPSVRLKDAELQWNKRGSALIKHGNLLPSPFFVAGTARLRLMGHCLLQQKFTTSISETDCDGTPIKCLVCIKMSTSIL